MKRHIPIILLLLIIISGCGPNCTPVVGTDEEIQPLDAPEALTLSEHQALIKPTSRKELQIWYDCQTFQLALEAWARRNGGFYPYNLSHPNMDGDSVIDLLPFERLLKNPFTKACTNPIDGVAATPGSIGYHPCIRNGKCVGYVITGFGKDLNIVTIFKDTDGYTIEVDIPGLNPDGTPIAWVPADIPPPPVESPETVPDKSIFKKQY